MNKIKDFELEIVCSPKRIIYGAVSKEDALTQFLEENPAFEENDVCDIKEKN